MDKSIYRKDINLLDRINNKALKSNPKGTFIIIVAVILIAIILIGIFVPKIIISTKNSTLNSLQSQLETNEVYETEYNDLLLKLDSSRKMLSDLSIFENGGLIGILEDLESNIQPTGISITSITISSELFVTINGLANDEKTVAELFYNISSDSNFSDVSVDGATSVTFGEGSDSVKSFTLTAQYAYTEE